MSDPTPAELIEALRQAGASVEDGRHWYRALGSDGSLWCETSNPREAVDSIDGRDGYTLQRLPLYLVRTPWEPWQPDPRKAPSTWAATR